MYLEVFQVLLLASLPPEENAVLPKKPRKIYLGETKERKEEKLDEEHKAFLNLPISRHASSLTYCQTLQPLMK